MPKISVVVPVYNVEKYLERALDSLLNQTLQDIEIICINDGSTDSSSSILDFYSKKDSRLVVINQQNKGVGVARNEALKVANGDYLGFLDPDDYLDSDFYETLYNIAKDKNSDIVKADFDMEHVDGKVTTTNENENIKKELERRNIPFNSFVTAWQSAIYKREMLVSKGILFAESQHLEDVAFLVKALYSAEHFELTCETKYHYFVRPGSLSRKKASIEKFESFFKSYEDIVNFINVDSSYKEKYKLCLDKILSGLENSMRHVIGIKGEKGFTYFAEYSSNIIQNCKYLDEYIAGKQNEFLNILLSKNYNALEKFLYCTFPELNFFEKLFSVKNRGGFKVFNILGFSFFKERRFNLYD